MEKQNITLSLPKALLKKAKAIASNESKSLSKLLKESLENRIANESGYNEARERQLEYLQTGFNLGTEGQIGVSRKELHERK